MKPSVGRIVHYVSYGTPGGEYRSECRAAVVAGVPVGALPLADSEHAEMWDSDAIICDLVLNPTGLFFNRCPYHEGDVGHDASGAEIPARSYHGGTWHWPERVDES